VSIVVSADGVAVTVVVEVHQNVEKQGIDAEGSTTDDETRMTFLGLILAFFDALMEKVETHCL
jgi:hypothetical protein